MELEYITKSPHIQHIKYSPESIVLWFASANVLLEMYRRCNTIAVIQYAFV